jgi:hypothetical protein
VQLPPELVSSIRPIRFRFSSHIDQLAIQMLKCVQGLGAGGQVSLPVLVRPQSFVTDECVSKPPTKAPTKAPTSVGFIKDRLPSIPQSRTADVDEVRQNY